jgi:ribosomal protein L25 (general stress protein Ctc)
VSGELGRRASRALRRSRSASRVMYARPEARCPIEFDPMEVLDVEAGVWVNI